MSFIDNVEAFFKSLWATVEPILEQFAVNLFTSSAKIVAQELGNDLPIATAWIKDGIQKAEDSDLKGLAKLAAAADYAKTQGETIGKTWADDILHTLAQNVVVVAKRDLAEPLIMVASGDGGQQPQ